MRPNRHQRAGGPGDAAGLEGRGAWLADVGARGGDGFLCRRCGAGLPDDAKYCVRCGELIRSEAGPGAPAAAGDECTIVWWRGYVKSGFFAFATCERARTAELGSSLFRKIGGSPPVPVPEGPALEAHRALVERMQSEGWDPVGRGAHGMRHDSAGPQASVAAKDAAREPLRHPSQATTDADRVRSPSDVRPIQSS